MVSPAVCPKGFSPAFDETLPQIHCIMAMLHAVEFYWDSAEKEFKQALELDLKSSDAWRGYEFWFLVPHASTG